MIGGRIFFLNISATMAGKLLKKSGNIKDFIEQYTQPNDSVS
jgi:hypothetical protein